MTDDLDSLLTVLTREHWRVEAVTVRIHVLRMAIAGDWPGSVDDADAGLSDAVDRAAQEELARAVVADGCGRRYGAGAEPTMGQLLPFAPDELAPDLMRAADGLAAAVDAARAAAAEVVARLEDAAYTPSAGALEPRITPARAAALARLLRRVVPVTLDQFLGLTVA